MAYTRWLCWDVMVHNFKGTRTIKAYKIINI